MRKAPQSILPESDQPLADPLQQLIRERDKLATVSDAEAIAQFLDISILAKKFKDHAYGAEKKIEILLEITEEGSPSEKMKAIKMLDEIWNSALVRRGMVPSAPAQALPPGAMDPLGLPQPVRRVEAVEMTSQRVRMVLGNVPEEPPDHTAPQPRVLPETNHVQESDQDDEYFPDNRDESCNIARTPSGELGRGK